MCIVYLPTYLYLYGKEYSKDKKRIYENRVESKNNRLLLSLAFRNKRPVNLLLFKRRKYVSAPATFNCFHNEIWETIENYVPPKTKSRMEGLLSKRTEYYASRT